MGILIPCGTAIAGFLIGFAAAWMIRNRSERKLSESLKASTELLKAAVGKQTKGQ